MSLAVTAVTAVAGVAGTMAYSAYTSNQASKRQAAAQREAVAQAEKQAAQAEREFNRTNAKKPNVGAIVAANQQASLTGQAGTMLTGPQGIDPTKLELGRKTLLGM